jgi:hypothetical protein
MHGGVKVYRGTAAAARNYVDGDRCRPHPVVYLHPAVHNQ